MISEVSYNVEDWSNGCWKFCYAIAEINYILKYIKIENILNFNTSQYYCFYCIFDETKAALVSITYFRNIKNLTDLTRLNSSVWHIVKYVNVVHVLYCTRLKIDQCNLSKTTRTWNSYCVYFISFYLISVSLDQPIYIHKYCTSVFLSYILHSHCVYVDRERGWTEWGQRQRESNWACYKERLSHLHITAQRWTFMSFY